MRKKQQHLKEIFNLVLLSQVKHFVILSKFTNCIAHMVGRGWLNGGKRGQICPPHLFHSQFANTYVDKSIHN
jgi:hypothetical protein